MSKGTPVVAQQPGSDRAAVSDNSAALRFAVARYRTLMAADPARWQPRLLRAIEAIADDHGDSDGAALAVLEDGVGHLRRLAAGLPSCHASALASALIALSVARFDRGDIVGAAAAAGEAAATGRSLTADGVDGAVFKLVAALKQESRARAVIADSCGALATLSEAAQVHRHVAGPPGNQPETSPVPLKEGLAWTLGLLGMRLRLAGRDKEAINITEEALSLLQPGEGAPAGSLTDAVRAYLQAELVNLRR